MSTTTIIADGSTRLFAYPFAIFSEKDLEIRVDGAVVTEGVTITGEGASDGGHVTFVNPPLAGAVVTLHRLGKVEVSDHDIPGFLEDKLVAGDNVAITRQTVADRETLVVSATFDGDDYLRKDQNLADLPDRAAARDNLGLGSAAVLDAGTGAGDLVRLDAEGRLPAVDGSRLTDIPFGRVKVSDGDTVADFLAAKLVAGDGISLTPGAGASGQAVTVAALTDPAVGEQLSKLSSQVSTLIWNQGVLALRSQIGAGWSVLKMVDGWADEFEDEIGIDVATSDNQSYDAAGDCYVNRSATTTVNSGSTGWYGYTGYFTFAANGDVSRTGASWNFGVYRSSADLTGDFEYSFTQTDETGNGGGGSGASFQFGISLVAGLSGYNLYGEDNPNLFYFNHNGVGASQTINFYRQRTVQASAVRAISPGDVFALRRRGMTLTAEHNGVTIHTFAGFSTTAPCFQGLGHGGSANENPKPTFGAVRWAVNQLVTDMTLVSNQVLAATTTPVEARLVLLHQPIDAVTPNTDLVAEVSRDDGVTWTAVELTDEGPFDATTTILAGTANIADQPAGTAMKWRVRTLNQKAQRLHGVWFQWR